MENKDKLVEIIQLLSHVETFVLGCKLLEKENLISIYSIENLKTNKKITLYYHIKHTWYNFYKDMNYIMREMNMENKIESHLWVNCDYIRLYY